MSVDINIRENKYNLFGIEYYNTLYNYIDFSWLGIF